MKDIKIRKDSLPIIFIHYGDSDYLKYTFLSALKTNPTKDIILIGDAENKHYSKIGVKHFLYEEYADSDELRLFNTVYRCVAGKEHLQKTFAEKWIKFVFERWFVMYNFMKQQGIHRFWTFDSDNLILSDLRPFEKKFQEYDCTTQCMGICMNGLVNSQEVVKGYIDKINEIFTREEYLKQQQEEFDTINPRYAFTEMRAFEVYQQESKIRTFRINTIIDNEAFDECIACGHHDMAMHSFEREKSFEKGSVKKLYLNPHNEVFSFHLPTQQYIKLHNLNMSWLPIFLIKRIFEYIFEKKITEEYFLIPTYLPWEVRIKRLIFYINQNAKNLIKKVIGYK